MTGVVLRLFWARAHVLPGAERVVLIYCPDEHAKVQLGYWDGHFWRNLQHRPMRVTHWMELPEPPHHYHAEPPDVIGRHPSPHQGA